MLEFFLFLRMVKLGGEGLFKMGEFEVVIHRRICNDSIKYDDYYYR